jgi:excisionase family DNA binding protein
MAGVIERMVRISRQQRDATVTSNRVPEPEAALNADGCLLRPDELASLLGIPLATIYRWRSRGDGPCGIRVGRHVRYRRDDVERWLDEQRDLHLDARPERA